MKSHEPGWLNPIARLALKAAVTQGLSEVEMNGLTMTVTYLDDGKTVRLNPKNGAFTPMGVFNRRDIESYQ